MDKLEKEIILGYITAYNNFDVAAMLKDVHAAIEFKNIANGEVNMTLKGIEQLRQQAEQAKTLFTQRHQEIVSITAISDQWEVEINYMGTLAIDLPNGMKKGEELSMKGKSIFQFSEGKISHLTDIS